MIKIFTQLTPKFTKIIGMFKGLHTLMTDSEACQTNDVIKEEAKG